MISLLGSPTRRITVHPVSGKRRTHRFYATLVDRKGDGSERLTPVRIKINTDLTCDLPGGLLLCGTCDGGVAIGNLDPARWGKQRGTVLRLLQRHLGWADSTVEFVLPDLTPDHISS